MRKFFAYYTSAGPFYIVRTPNGMFHPFFNDESLGNYVTPQQAVDDLAHGNTIRLGNGVDPATLAIPDDLTEWVIL